MELELQVLGEVLRVSEDDPADAGVDEAEFVAGGVDAFDAGELEVPFEAGFGVREGCDEGS